MENRKNNYIDRSDVENHFKLRNRKFVQFFFVDKNVSCNEYILFVCFFLFYRNEDILSLLISISGANSNLFITKEQINKFFEIYEIDEKYFQDLPIYLEESVSSKSSIHSEAYNLQSFYYYLLRNKSFQHDLIDFKQEIINLTIDKETIERILIRKNYYDSIVNKMDDNITSKAKFDKTYNTPTEPCLNKLYRILFTLQPPPFYYDFVISSSPSIVRMNVINQLKQRYSPSIRSNSVFIQSSLSPKSLQRKNTYYSFKNKPIYPSNSIHSERRCSESPNVYNRRGRSGCKIYPSTCI